MSRFDVEFKIESETVIALDRSASIPLDGAGSVELSPTGMTVLGDLVQTSKPMAVLAGVAALLGGFIVAVLWQGERWPPAGIALALALFGVAGLAFSKRRRLSRSQQIAVAWSTVGHVYEVSFHGHWQITVKQPMGTLSFKLHDANAIDGFHDQVIAAHQLGLVAATFLEREIASAELR